MAFQSSLPGYRGATKESSNESDNKNDNVSLTRTASLRLICHMLREPFFDSLRTKQQLGYIVNSSYHTSLSTIRDTIGQQSQELDDTSILKNPFKVMTIEYIYLTILSKKEMPANINKRIDEFLCDFREVLKTMPESEITSHSTSLCTKMLKPIQKLNNEVQYIFAKIRRFAPEMINHQDSEEANIPWNIIEDIASAVSTITRKDLLNTWDEVVTGYNRCRIVSNVYGKTFPLQEKIPFRGFYRKTVVTNNVQGILQSRNELAKGRQHRRYFSNSLSIPNFLWDRFHRNKAVATATAVVLGVGLVGVGYFYCNDSLLLNQSRDRTRQQGKEPV